MKTLLFITSVLFAFGSFSQTDSLVCSGLPMATPEVKASVSADEVAKFFQSSISEKLKKGTHTAVYKLFVDCNGDVTQATYQRGTFTEADQKVYSDKILTLKWKPATDKSKPVTSVAFVSIEIVNGKVTVVIQ